MSILNYHSGSPFAPPLFGGGVSGFVFEDEDATGFLVTHTFGWDSVDAMLAGGVTVSGNTDFFDCVRVAPMYFSDQSDPMPTFVSIVTDSDEYFNGDGDYDDGSACRGNADLTQCDLGVPHWVLAGVTKTGTTGVALAACVVDLLDTATDVKKGSVTSDGAGNYSIPVYYLGPFYAVAYKAGSPDVAGTTVNTLTPSPQ